MKKDNTTKLTREESMARWKRRTEKEENSGQDAVTRLKTELKEEKIQSELLEREFWRATHHVSIKEHDPYHFVVISPHENPIRGGLQNLFFVKKVIVDKPTQSITVERRFLMLFKTQYVIPFSAVQRVVVDYILPWHSNAYYDEHWQVFLHTDRKKIKIDGSSNEQRMLALGRAISKFVRTAFEVGSTKPDETDVLSQPKTFDRDRLPSKWNL